MTNKDMIVVDKRTSDSRMSTVEVIDWYTKNGHMTPWFKTEHETCVDDTFFIVVNDITVAAIKPNTFQLFYENLLALKCIVFFCESTGWGS